MENSSNNTVMGDNGVIVRNATNGRFAQEIMIGQHTLIADEPITNGGNDLGPSPYDLLLAALGTCTAMTLRMYADLNHIPLQQAIVKLTHEKIYAKDCENCENNNAKIDHINRYIELQGNLDAEQRKKLLEIANKCPVHRTLTSNISITTMLIK